VPIPIFGTRSALALRAMTCYEQDWDFPVSQLWLPGVFRWPAVLVYQTDVRWDE
jgi:hypothetical protein